MPLAALNSDELAFVQNHSKPTVRTLLPRFQQIKEAHLAGAPLCTTAPAMTGTPTVGQVLTCSSGTWTNSPTFTYQWRRRRAGTIAGATSTTYTLVAADSGATIECQVTATNGAGVTQTNSNYVTIP
jgi:hypothetical protein